MKYAYTFSPKKENLIDFSRSKCENLGDFFTNSPHSLAKSFLKAWNFTQSLQRKVWVDSKNFKLLKQFSLYVVSLLARAHVRARTRSLCPYPACVYACVCVCLFNLILLSLSLSLSLSLYLSLSHTLFLIWEPFTLFFSSCALWKDQLVLGSSLASNTSSMRGMRPIVLSIHSFITSRSPYCPLCMV